MANPPPLLTAGDPVMDALLFDSEEDEDYIQLHYIKHVKIAIAGSITELTNMPSPDIARTHLVCNMMLMSS